jgi:hypothetical protein
VDFEQDGIDVVEIGNSSRHNFEKTVIYDLGYGTKRSSLEFLKEKTGANIAPTLPDWLKEDLAATAQESNKEQPDFIIILGNDTYYYGYFPWKDHETGEEIMVKGLHEPMITEDEYWRAQMLLGKKGKARPKVREFAYTGLMKCGECHSGITAEEKLQIICSGCKHKFSYINKQQCPFRFHID